VKYSIYGGPGCPNSENGKNIDPEKGDILKQYSTDDGLPDDKITALDYRAIEQSVWIGTEKSGVYQSYHPVE
jgi:hypothetical protein